MILWHGHFVCCVRWDEAKPDITALHLRKCTGAMSIQRQLAQHTARGAACACESGYVTNNALGNRLVFLGTNRQ